MTKEQKIILTLKGGSVSINELEISQDTAAKIVRLVMPLGSDAPLVTEDGGGVIPRVANNLTDGISAKQFMTVKRPKSDMERITCLAYYLNHHKGVGTFKTTDLTHLNVEAAQPKLSNPSATARNAVDQQYLAPAGGGKKQITPRGEALVDALPDRGAVKEAMDLIPLRTKKRKAAASSSKKGRGAKNKK